jgi:hypothetical protein
MSALAYFASVAVVTVLGIGLAMQLRPAFSHTVLELVGLEREPQANPDSAAMARGWRRRNCAWTVSAP